MLPPPCCTDTPPTASPSTPHTPVPVITQYASPTLIRAIVYQGHDPAHDPRWRESGAPSRTTYGKWCGHMCGMACLRMALIHRDGRAPHLFDLLAGARAYGAYTEDEDDGDIRGLIYAPFADYVRETHALPAEVHRQLEMEELSALLDAGRMVLTSVSKEIRRSHQPPERRGGHLVLAIGRHPDGRIEFRNPSGHTDEARTATLAVETFATFFAGRGVSLDVTTGNHSRRATA